MANLTDWSRKGKAGGWVWERVRKRRMEGEKEGNRMKRGGKI